MSTAYVQNYSTMKLVHSLSEHLDLQSPSVLTIGFFDGVHLGHQMLLQRSKELAQENDTSFTVITFENHPSEVLRPDQSISFICTLQHKIRLLEQIGTDVLVLLPFTHDFSRQSAEEFLGYVQEHIPFSHLVLGHDAVLGKDKTGNKNIVQKIAKASNFQVEYLPPFSLDGEVVSSTRIRTAIQQGDFSKCEKLLGRRYSIYGPVIAGRTHGKIMGFPTANIDVGKLCLPPGGVYAVKVLYEGQEIDAVANLGVAPTVRNDNKLLLEAHLLNWDKDLYNQMIEVVFCEYIRPERKFSDLSELRDQIERDVQTAKRIFGDVQN